MISVRVRMFAMLRELAGTGEITLELEDGATVSSACDSIGRESPVLEPLLSTLPVAAAVNRRYCAAETPLRDGDELALIPPVSGGAPPRVHASIDGEPRSPDDLVALVADPHAGATVTFTGTTRSVDALEYESYREMALPLMRSILTEVARHHGVIALAAHHRLGRVPRGEAGVVVAASGGHREETFAAARAAIDRIKAELPIWKREVDGDSATWVAGTAAGPPGRGEVPS